MFPLIKLAKKLKVVAAFGITGVFILFPLIKLAKKLKGSLLITSSEVKSFH